MDRLTSMLAFVTTVDAGSFRAASVRLRLSPQMVAKHVAFLESRLGVRLLNRTTRRQSLTEFGSLYCERCRRIVAEVDAADALAAELRSEPRGLLRVTAPVLFGAQMVVPFVDDFMRRHPAIRVDLMLTNRIVDLVEERCEIAFRIGTLDDSSLKARALAPYRLIACAAPSYLAAHGVPRHPRDLADHACLGGPAWLRTLGAEWIFKRATASFRVAVGHGTPHRSVRSQIKAARDGKGIVLAGPRSVRSELEAGDLVQVLQRFEAPSMPMHLVFQPGRSQTPAVRTFITSATAEFGTAPSGPASARPPAR